MRSVACRPRPSNSLVADRLASYFGSSNPDTLITADDMTTDRGTSPPPPADELVLDRQAVRQAWRQRSRFCIQGPPLPNRATTCGWSCEQRPDRQRRGRRHDKALVKLIARGRRWYELLTTGQRSSLREIAHRKLDESRLPLSFLRLAARPDIIEKALRQAGNQSASRQPLKRLLRRWTGASSGVSTHAALNEAAPGFSQRLLAAQ